MHTYNGCKPAVKKTVLQRFSDNHVVSSKFSFVFGFRYKHAAQFRFRIEDLVTRDEHPSQQFGTGMESRVFLITKISLV